MPPCNWIISPATSENASEQADLAAAARRGSAAGSPAAAKDAPSAAERADSTSTYASASRCLTAWKEPMGRLELDPLTGVGDRELQTARGGADLFGGERRARHVQDVPQHPSAATLGPEVGPPPP